MICQQCHQENRADARFCVTCGNTLAQAVPPTAFMPPPLQSTPPSIGPTQYLQPMSLAQSARQGYPPKPSKVQSIAIMCLVDGVLNIGWGLGLISTICLAPLGIYAIILGIFEIIYATKVLPDPITATAPNKMLTYMQIANIITGDVISLTVGILSLVFYNEEPVQAYFSDIAARQPSAQ